MVDEYSGYDIVTLTDKKCIVKVSEVLRIVMLYRIENLKFIVVDYNRISLPVDFVQVPFFPVQNDVVVVNLCDGESIAVVLSVNEWQKCQNKVYGES